MLLPDYLDSGGYQPSQQVAAPDLSTTTAEAANAVISGSQNSYEVIIENIDLNLYKDYGFVFSYILSNDDPKDTTIVLGPISPRFIVTQAQVAASIPDYTEAPTNVVATGGVLSYQVTWDKPTWENYTDTIIWEGSSRSFNGSEPVVWTGTGTQANILASTTADRYIKILHRDKFFHSNTTSANKYVIKGPIKPVDPIVVDITGPPAVSSAQVTGGIDPSAYLGFNGYATVQWGAVTSGDIRGYRIRFKPVGDSVYSYADSPGSGTSYKLEGLGVGVTYEFAVATYDQYNNTTSGYVSGGTLAIPGTPVMNGYISAGEFKFGDGVVSGKRGLLFNPSNYWYINSGSTAEFKVGGPNSNYIKWDGDTLNIDGNIGATGTATIGGNINLSTSGASIYNGTINTNGTLTGNGFALNSTGLKVANGSNSVTLDAASGTITANAGSIGGWSLSGNTLSQNNAEINSSGYVVFGSSTPNNMIKITSQDADYVMWAGNNNGAYAPFSVSKTGALHATGAIITGDVTITSGTTKDAITAAQNDATSAYNRAGTAIDNAALAKKAAEDVAAVAMLETNINTVLAKNTTVIDGSRVTTGTIDVARLNIAGGNASSGSYFVIDGNGIQAFNNYSRTFYVSNSGQLDIIGKITATSGKIGDWNVNSDGSISNGTTYFYGGTTYGNQPDWAIFDMNKFAYFKGILAGSVGYQATSGNIITTSGSIIATGGDVSVGLVKTVLYSDGTIYANSMGVYSGASALAIRQVQAAASGANSQTGFLRVNASSRRFKKDIVVLQEGGYLDLVTRMSPVSFIDINEDESAPRAIGLIAEEVAKIDELTDSLVPKDENGDPFAINYPLVGVVSLMALKEIKSSLQLINDRLDALEI